jgi:ubiquitin C-terminal hydrolase
MTSYAPHSNHSSKNLASKYKLYGISKHSGDLEGGHYVGDVMNVDNN